jgi:hypothetical protein
MPRHRRKPGDPFRRPGPATRFPNKSRIPFALCLPNDLQVKLVETAERLHLRRGDVICFLIERYAHKLDVTGGSASEVA